MTVDVEFQHFQQCRLLVLFSPIFFVMFWGGIRSVRRKTIEEGWFMKSHIVVSDEIYSAWHN